MLKGAALLLSIAVATQGLGIPASPDRPGVIQAGLSSDAAAPAAPSNDDQTIAASTGPECPADVTFFRSIPYDADQALVLDVATTAQAKERGVRAPIVVFFSVDENVGDEAATAVSLTSQAMCFAAAHGLAAFHVTYHAENAWSDRAKTVTAALSWVFANADLFGGNVHEIVPIAYGDAASHLMSLVLSEHSQLNEDYLAGLVLVSASFLPQDVANLADQNKLTDVGIPIVMAWSAEDPPDVKANNEKFTKLLCDAGHCPRVAVLGKASNPGSVFDLDGVSGDLHQRLRQLIGQLDARGLP